MLRNVVRILVAACIVSVMAYADTVPKRDFFDTPLRRAIYDKEVKTVDWILSHPIPTAVSVNGDWFRLDQDCLDYCLYFAVDSNEDDRKKGSSDEQSMEILKMMLAHGANPNTYRGSLTWEVTSNPEVAKLLLKAGADVNHRYYDDYGITRTPLMMAVRYSKIEVAILLLEAGADVHARDRFDYTVLHSAAKSEPAMLGLVLKHGAGLDIDVQEKQWGNTALMVAIGKKRGSEKVENAKLLLDAHPDLTLKSKEGGTALDWALKVGNQEIITLLKDASSTRIAKIDEQGSDTAATTRTQESAPRSPSARATKEAASDEVPIPPAPAPKLSRSFGYSMGRFTSPESEEWGVYYPMIITIVGAAPGDIFSVSVEKDGKSNSLGEFKVSESDVFDGNKFDVRLIAKKFPQVFGTAGDLTFHFAHSQDGGAPMQRGILPYHYEPILVEGTVRCPPSESGSGYLQLVEPGNGTAGIVSGLSGGARIGAPGTDSDIEVGDVGLIGTVKRGYIRFNLAEIPKGATIKDVWLTLHCSSPATGVSSEEHRLDIRHLSLDPITLWPKYNGGQQATFQEMKDMYDAIRRGQVLATGLRFAQRGQQRINLGGAKQLVADALSKGWFAIGLREQSDSHHSATFQSNNTEGVQSYLEIEYRDLQ